MNSATCGEEELIQKHKKERKTLQAEIQKIKHVVPKGDKKRKKDAQVQIAQLEAEMDARHKAELDALAAGDTSDNNQAVDEVTEQLNDLEAGDTEEQADEPQKGKKVSKAQKRRGKKDQQAKEREDRIREQEIINIEGPRNQETKLLKKKLKARGLAVYEVPSDGNCLYAGLVHQLERRDIPSSIKSLRKQCADHMTSHAEDFLPFLCQTDSGDPFTDEQFQNYLDELENTAAWGGQLEIRALANVLQQPIEVIQADTPSVLQGEEFEEVPLVLIYHRHMYGLGEHYNSVIPISEVVQDEEEFT